MNREPSRYTYSIQPDSGLVVIDIAPEATVEDFRRLFDDLAGDSQCHQMNLLCDLRKLATPIKLAEQKGLVDYTGRYREVFDGIRMAVIVASDVDHGMVRMADALEGGAGINVAPFRDDESARKWLGTD